MTTPVRDLVSPLVVRGNAFSYSVARNPLLDSVHQNGKKSYMQCFDFAPSVLAIGGKPHPALTVYFLLISEHSQTTTSNAWYVVPRMSNSESNQPSHVGHVAPHIDDAIDLLQPCRPVQELFLKIIPFWKCTDWDS